MRRALIGKAMQRAVDAKLRRLFPGRFQLEPRLPGKTQKADWLHTESGTYIDLTSIGDVAAHVRRYKRMVVPTGADVVIVPYRTWRWRV
jgi:hypothetical protein